MHSNLMNQREEQLAQPEVTHLGGAAVQHAPVRSDHKEVPHVSQLNEFCWDRATSAERESVRLGGTAVAQRFAHCVITFLPTHQLAASH